MAQGGDLPLLICCFDHHIGITSSPPFLIHAIRKSFACLYNPCDSTEFFIIVYWVQVVQITSEEPQFCSDHNTKPALIWIN